MRLANTDETPYRFEKNRKKSLVRDVRCPNGITFSMDERWFYQADSIKCTNTRYEYDASIGRISNPSIFYQGNEAEGVPNGISLDIEDHVWVAFWGGSFVYRLDPHVSSVLEIPIPTKQPSSVIFYGSDPSYLYITSAAENAIDIGMGLDKNGRFLGGHVYRYRTPFKGRQECLADFD